MSCHVRVIRPFVLSLVLTLASIAGQASAQQLLGVEWLGKVYTVDVSTGLATELGPSGFIALNAMARGPDGTYYSAAYDLFENDSTLIRIDPATGAGTEVLPLPGLDVRSMAVDDQGVLWISSQVRTEPTGEPKHSEIWRLDLETLQLELLVRLHAGFQGMAFHAGRLYAWDAGLLLPGDGRGLMTLDRVTGKASDVNDDLRLLSDARIQFLVSGHGLLLGGSREFFVVNPVTGDTIQVTPSDYPDLRGVEWLD